MKESLHKVSFGSEWHKINLKFLNCLALIAGMVVLTALIGCKGKDNRLEKVIVYTYNSFSGEWGAGPEVARLFKEKTGLTVEYAKAHDARVLIRGLRAVSDFEYEFALNAAYEYVDPEIDVVFFMSHNETSFISSSTVDSLFKSGVDVSKLVPESVIKMYHKKFK